MSRAKRAAATTGTTRAGTPLAARPATDIPAWLPAAAYALLTILLFREFIFGSSGLLGIDTLALGYVARDYYTESVRQLGEFPLWNPLIFGGVPFVEGKHGDVFHPLSVALLFLSPAQAWGWKLVLHVFLAGIFTCGWLRQLELSRSAAFLGGLIYMLGAHLVSLVFPGADGKIFVGAVAPLLFWLTERAVSRRRLSDFAFLALGLPLVLWSHPQLAYFTVWGLSLYFFFRVAQQWHAQRRHGESAKLIGLFAVAGLVGVVASADFLPSLEYLGRWSRRAATTVEASTPERAYQYSTTWSLHAEEVAALVVPEFVGDNAATETSEGNTYWGRNPFKLNHEYAGFLPLLLLPLLFFRRRSARTWFFAAVGLFAVIYALGASTPAFRLFYLIPGVKLFRAPSLIIFLFALSMATLGAFAIERLLQWAAGDAAEQKTARRYLWGATAACGALALLTAAGLLVDAWQALLYQDLPPNKAAALEANLPRLKTGFWITFGVALMTAAIFEARARHLASARVAVVLLAIVVVADELRVARPFVRATVAMNERLDPALFDLDPSMAYLQDLQAQGEVFRAWDIGGYQSTNTLAAHGLEQLAGHHPNDIGRYRELIGGEEASNVVASELRLLNLANVQYLLSPGLVDVPGYTEAFRGTRTVVYRNEAALPRAFLVGAVELVPDSLAVARLLSPSFEPRRAVVLPEPLPAGVSIQPDPQGGVEWLERGANAYTLRVSSDRPALLVISENYYDAWHAAIDGEPVPLLRANYTFRAVPVPAGEHVVALRYQSDLLRASVFASAAVILLLTVIGLLGWSRDWRAETRA